MNLNTARWLSACLESLRNVRGVQHELIVVDNGSSDDSARVVREGFPETKPVINPAMLGFAKGNNQAMRLGRGCHFFLLNNGTVLREGCVESLARFLDAIARASMVTGHLENADGSKQFIYYPVELPSLGSLTTDLLWPSRIWPRNRSERGISARR